ATTDRTLPHILRRRLDFGAQSATIHLTRPPATRRAVRDILALPLLTHLRLTFWVFPSPADLARLLVCPSRLRALTPANISFAQPQLAVLSGLDEEHVFAALRRPARLSLLAIEHLSSAPELPVLQRRANAVTHEDIPPKPALVDFTRDPELRLPKRASLVIMISANVLLQISFFIIVSSSNEYALHLGGTSTFSGIVIGVPTLFSGLALIPLARYDKGVYTLPLHVACCASIIGHVLYALAYYADFLYLILLGRIVSGLSFTLWMYCKRYCSDPRIVGVRRRTTLASWLVIGQGIGMSLGPFAGGLLYKVGFGGRGGLVWNGFTAPAWVMAGVWVLFWALVWWYYEDIPSEQRAFETSSEPLTSTLQAATVTQSSNTRPSLLFRLAPQQRGVILCMCWFAMTCFFILGAWESNVPVFGASTPPFYWSPFAAGNFLALGGATTFPFLIVNLLLARRTQDRLILALGTTLGLCGLVIFLGLLGAGGKALNYGAVYVCWWAVALGFNLASTVTMSTLSKTLPPKWNGRTSLAIQYSNYTGRVAGAVWGGSGVAIGMRNYIGLQIGLVGVGAALSVTMWRNLKTKMG
ncbi:hypothetical protein C0992_006896, partial [Termitomyces sp. T32_za158]